MSQKMKIYRQKSLVYHRFKIKYIHYVIFFRFFITFKVQRERNLRNLQNSSANRHT